MMSQREPNLRIERHFGTFAWVMWFVAFAVISTIVWPSPLRHSVCWNYYQPAKDWWAGLDLYRFNYKIDGFLYLPQFALFYTPFMVLGHPIGDIVWRGLGLALLSTGVWRMAQMLAPGRVWIIFALATAAVLPAAVASLRNGEANLHIAGIMLQATVKLRARRWGWAAFWLTGGVVVKPIMIVMTLLAGAMYRPVIVRLFIGGVLIAAVPYLFQSSHYVSVQYREYGHVMSVAAQPPDLYCNIRGLLGKMGWVMSQVFFQCMAAIAAVVTLGVCLVAKRRWPEPVCVKFLLGFSACYLMLCNPRTESNSYVIIAPVIALPAAMLLTVRNRPRAAMGLYVLSFMLICDFWGYKKTENWLKPLTCVVVSALLVRELFVLRGCRRFEETA